MTPFYNWQDAVIKRPAAGVGRAGVAVHDPKQTSNNLRQSFRPTIESFAQFLAKASSHRGWRRIVFFGLFAVQHALAAAFLASIVARLRVDLSSIVRVRIPMLTLMRAVAAFLALGLGPDGIPARCGPPG